MKIKILGGGPAGLYAAYRIRRELPDADVTVYEQNDAHTTFGFGVVFSDKALEFLGAGDSQTLPLITAPVRSRACASWRQSPSSCPLSCWLRYASCRGWP